LALEEYALTVLKRDLIMLWRNAPSVIIGRNQNAAEELDMDYIRENAIPVIRRQSGGGAVFHDLGNINYTLIHLMGRDDFSNYGKFTAPVCDFLRGLGVDARLEGRNDLVIGGMKFSGNAQAAKNGRIMHHGTILFDADVARLAKALKPRAAKIESKGVKSVSARVTNAARHLPKPMSVDTFFSRLALYFQNSDLCTGLYELTDADIKGVQKLVAEKYSQWAWNIGQSPPYDFEKTARFPYGIVDIRLRVSRGIIEQMHILGDFFGILEVTELSGRLQGVRHSREAIADALTGISISDYIHGMTREAFLDLIV
ncbi:MAG: lipoate--protein ligase, partial [Oscillospiraceae bacterium]|nr:lipoate--protein ligase [Oscillospiraceae bacterium]